MLPGPRPTSLPIGILVHPATWPQQTWAENWGHSPRPNSRWRGAGFPSNTLSPGSRSTSLPSGTFIHPAVWQNRHGKIGVLLCSIFLGEGSWLPMQHNATWAEVYLLPSGILIHPAVWPQQTWAKFVVLLFRIFLGGGSGSPSNNMAWVKAYLLTKWHLDASSRLATTDMGRKLGAVPPFWKRSWVSTKNNVAGAEGYLHAKFHFDSSKRLTTIHQRYRQDRQTDIGQRSDSIGRTVSSNVRPEI